jgi:hypothetical protein
MTFSWSCNPIPRSAGAHDDLVGVLQERVRVVERDLALARR